MLNNTFDNQNVKHCSPGGEGLTVKFLLYPYLLRWELDQHRTQEPDKNMEIWRCHLSRKLYSQIKLNVSSDCSNLVFEFVFSLFATLHSYLCLVLHDYLQEYYTASKVRLCRENATLLLGPWQSLLFLLSGRGYPEILRRSFSVLYLI